MQRDATSVTPRSTTYLTQRTIGPAMQHARAARPMGGALGAVLGAGESVHNGIVARRQAGLKPEDYLLLATMAAPELAPEVKALTRAAAPAEEAMLTGEQLQEWRKIASHLNSKNVGAVRQPMPLPRSRVPILPDRPGAAGMEIPVGPLANMHETGFANLPMTPESVLLPASGAGRAGSTATAMKAALARTTPQDFQAMVKKEIARRGGLLNPETEMAATEQVARDVASRPSVLADSAASFALKGIHGTKLTAGEAADWAAARNDPSYIGSKEHFGDQMYHNRRAREAATKPGLSGLLREKYGDAWGSTRESQNTLAHIRNLDAEYRALEAQRNAADSYRRIRGVRLSMDAPPPTVQEP